MIKCLSRGESRERPSLLWKSLSSSSIGADLHWFGLLVSVGSVLQSHGLMGGFSIVSLSRCHG